MPSTYQENASQEGNTSLADFSKCHAGIISHLMSFSALPSLLEPSAQARSVAKDALEFFHSVIYEHHSEEEWDLFPVVLQQATPGEEQEWVRSMVERLTLEHRQIEAMWSRLEPELKQIVEGLSTFVDVGAVHSMVLDYGAHAAFEETDFLPLARTILARRQPALQELGRSLHARSCARDEDFADTA